jgi:hypothetical protein
MPSEIQYSEHAKIAYISDFFSMRAYGIQNVREYASTSSASAKRPISKENQTKSTHSVDQSSLVGKSTENFLNVREATLT